METELCQVSSVLDCYPLTFLLCFWLCNPSNLCLKHSQDATLEFSTPSLSLSSTATEFKCFTVLHILLLEITDGEQDRILRSTLIISSADVTICVNHLDPFRGRRKAWDFQHPWIRAHSTPTCPSLGTWQAGSVPSVHRPHGSTADRHMWKLLRFQLRKCKAPFLSEASGRCLTPGLALL